MKLLSGISRSKTLKIERITRPPLQT